MNVYELAVKAMEREKITIHFDSGTWYGSWGGVPGASNAEGPRCGSVLEAILAAVAVKKEC